MNSTFWVKNFVFARFLTVLSTDFAFRGPFLGRQKRCDLNSEARSRLTSLRAKTRSAPKDAVVQSGKSSMKTMIASATAALLLLAGAGVANAADSADTVHVAVSRAGLDLAKPQDAQRMMKRIDAAALEACGAYPQSALGVKRAIAASSCHQDAVAGAVAQLNSSQAALSVTGVRGR
jgi:UrcA family protein